MGLFSNQVIGVDIGHSSVKVVGLNLGRTPSFVGCKEITMDPKYLRKDGFENAEIIGKALLEAMKTAAPHALAAKPLVYSALSEALVFRKILELPLIADEKELMNVIRLQSAEYLPDTPDNHEIDFQLLGPTPEGGNQQIMVVAVNKRVIQQYLAVFAAAKLTVRAVEAKPAAIARAMIKLGSDESVLLVDIGSEITTISLYSEGIVRVTGSLNLGGNIIRDPETLEVVEDKQDERIKRLATSVADEIDHVLKFYRNRSASKQEVKEIRLAGGGSMIAGVTEALAAECNLPVIAGKPVIDLPPFCDRRFYGALGCALYPLAEAAE